MISDNPDIAFKKIALKRTNQKPKLPDEVSAHLRVIHNKLKIKRDHINRIDLSKQFNVYKSSGLLTPRPRFLII